MASETPAPHQGTPVSEHEDLHRAIRPEYVASDGVSSAAFDTKDLSVDVASLTSLQESHARKPDWYLGTVTCRLVRSHGYVPVHDPIVDDPDLGTNLAHAIVPGRIRKSAARALALEARHRLQLPLV